jgi:eukaryotic-like serine/threonine-protein kinase
MFDRQGNIFIDEFWSVRIGDFGLSTVGDSTEARFTTSAGVAGTSRWMAPERILSTSDIRRSTHEDVYALGCLCYSVKPQIS